MPSRRRPSAPQRTRPQFRWMMPSFHGDLRLDPHPTDPAKTNLIIFDPTPDEQRIVAEIITACVAHGWLKAGDDLGAPGAARDRTVTIDAPVADLGPIVAALMQPSAAVLTAIKISDGRVVTSSGGPAALRATLDEVAPAEVAPSKEERKPAPASTAAAPEGQKPAPKEAEAAPKPVPTAAATVKRATPCCPQCIPGSIGPAREVLLTFLSPEQHAQWARERAIVVAGGLSGHRYLLAHRHSEQARRQGRICMDLDDQAVIHFHDNTVPPEEEVLGAMLILRYREPWLRNEATLFGASRVSYKNPFGGVMDGRADALIMEGLGEGVLAAARMFA